MIPLTISESTNSKALESLHPLATSFILCIVLGVDVELFEFLCGTLLIVCSSPLNLYCKKATWTLVIPC